MWIYEKRLEYPVNITKPDPRMAKLLLAQYGGPDSELGAALRYLTQRYSMPDDRVKAALTDIGTEELAHYEMIGAMIRQCMQGATCAELDQADLTEDMGAEQKARATYEHLMNMTGNEQILEPLYFLREREVVHFQRFGECLEIIQGIYNGRSSCSCRNARRRRP